MGASATRSQKNGMISVCHLLLYTEGSDRVITGPRTALNPKRNAQRLRQALLTIMLSATAQVAIAQDLVYTPINPSFGGSPLNSSHLLSTANAQRTATARDAQTDPILGGDGFETPGSSNADLSVRQLEARLLSALASQVTSAIFDGEQDNGTVTFGSTTVTFERTLDSLRLVIIDSLDGTVTEIVVPQLVTSG